LIAEPEPAMREILRAEITEQMSITVDAVERIDFSSAQVAGTVVVALPTRARKLIRELPPGVRCIPLRVRSVEGSLEREAMPRADVVISIVSRSPEIRYGARAMLIAVGVDPISLCEVDATIVGWKDRIGRNAFVITDLVTGRDLPEGCVAKVYRVIADSSIAELKRCCAV
jgi:hypothetical protein